MVDIARKMESGLPLNACPVCCAEQEGAGQRTIIRCDACGHCWMVSSEADQSAVEQSTYTRDYDGYREDPVFEGAIRTILQTEIAPRKAPPAQILDVGCGAGAFLQAAVEAGYEAQGIDVSPASAEICRSRGLKAVAGDFLTHDFGQQFDIITTWDVLEHLRDPAAFFRRGAKLLKPGGLFMGKVPGFGALSVHLSRAVPRLGRVLLGAPAHVQYFDEASFRRLANRAEFEVDWLPIGNQKMRTATTGGSIKRRFARTAARSINSLSGDRNIYFAAQRASESGVASHA